MTMEPSPLGAAPQKAQPLLGVVLPASNHEMEQKREQFFKSAEREARNKVRRTDAARARVHSNGARLGSERAAVGLTQSLVSHCSSRSRQARGSPASAAV